MNQIHISPSLLPLRCLVVPVYPLVADQQLHWCVNVAVWALWQGGRPLLQDRYIGLPIHVHEVLPYPAQCVNPLRVTLHFTGH